MQTQLQRALVYPWESKTLNYELEQNDFLRSSFGIDAKMCGIADNSTTLAN